MTTLQDSARAITDSLRAGDLDRAQTHATDLQRLVASNSAKEDRLAAIPIVLEARKLASMHRAETIQALQALIRGQLYVQDDGSLPPTFQIDG